MYTIYKIINRNNNKIYIGRTKNFNRRMAEHRRQYNRPDRTNNSPLYIAIRKEGLENFYSEIIITTDDINESYNLEKYYIKYYRETLGKENVYNYQDGGVGGQSHNIDGKNNPMYGRHWSTEEKIHKSLMNKGRKKPKGFGEKISKVLKGRKKSPESIRKSVLKQGHRVSVINVKTNEIRHYVSYGETMRNLHCDIHTLLKGHITQSGWKLYEENK